MEAVTIAKEILRCITELGDEGKLSKDLITAKANAMGEYDKNLGVAVSTLKAEGKAISIIEKLAKSRCSDLLIKKIVAEETLKAHYSKLDRLKAQLNGLQSINRYLDSVSG